MTLKPPPDAVAFEDAKFDPHLTMREKITELTKNTICMGCHATINPLGFSLENYDAIGRWRTKDDDKPIDAGERLRHRRGRDDPPHRRARPREVRRREAAAVTARSSTSCSTTR